MILAQRLGLSRFEQEILLLGAAMEWDPHIARLCAQHRTTPNDLIRPSLWLLPFCDAGDWSVLSPERPLRYWRLMKFTSPGAQCLTTSPLRADERIVNF